MLSENDTARRDVLILIMGLLAGGWFFLDYGNHHPLGNADASFGKQQILSQGKERLDMLGYPRSGVQYLASFRINGDLQNYLQKQAGREGRYSDTHTDNTTSGIFLSTYWNLDIFYPSDAVRGEADLEQTNLEESVSMTLIMSEGGEWMGLRNPGRRRPVRLFSEEALGRVFENPGELLSEERGDSVALATFTFSLEEDRGGDLTGTREGIQIGPNQADNIARYYLDQTGWPVGELALNSAHPVPFDEFEAAELQYLHNGGAGGTQLRLKVLISPAGALLSLTAEYPGLGDGMADTGINMGSLRLLLLIVFCFWLLVLLYIRIRLRVIDIKPAVLFAFLAGLAAPAILVLRWLHDHLHIPGSPGITDIVLLLFSSVFSAALVSLVFFVITVIGESFARQNRIEKIRTMDLIRIGHFFNRPVGTVFVHAVSFSLMLAALWSFMHWLLPAAYISPDSSFLSDTTFLAPFVQVITVFFLCFLTVQIIFLILAGQFSRRSKSGFVTVAVATAVFAVMAPVQVGSGPFTEEIILNGLTGLTLGLIYVYRDFLTAFLSYFLFTLLLTTADGWLMTGSPDLLIFLLTAGMISGLLIIGYAAAARGKRVKELPVYVPDYIEDLAREDRIKQELQIARKVQQSFLPVRNPTLEEFDLAAVCLPAHETGGDYYDFIELEDNLTAITVGDVSGKGFQAAFYMTFIKGVLHALCQDYDSTVTILKKANKLFRENARKGTFVSLIFGIIDPVNRKFTFSRAGHNPLLYYSSRENRLQMIRPEGLALGMTGGDLFKKHIRELEIHLEKGDMLILFTDGIVEATNWKGMFYGDNRLQRIIYFHHSKSAQEIVDHILDDIHEFSDGASQHDDMTLVVIKQK